MYVYIYNATKGPTSFPPRLRDPGTAQGQPVRTQLEPYGKKVKQQ